MKKQFMSCYIALKVFEIVMDQATFKLNNNFKIFTD